MKKDISTSARMPGIKSSIQHHIIRYRLSDSSVLLLFVCPGML